MAQVNVTFIPEKNTPNGQLTDTTVMPAQTGERLVDVALKAGIPLQMACGGNAACSTCRLIIKSGKLSPKEEMEELWGLPEGERLSCQCIIQDEDIVAEVPA